jgi:hypothetical protein
MSDVAGAPAPAASPAPTPASAPTPLAPAMESYTDAATARLTELKSNAEWRTKYLAGGARERDEFRTLQELAHGQGRDDASRAALAESIGLKPRASLALAERQHQAASDAAAALAPNLGDWRRRAGPELAAQVTADLSTWVSGLPLSPDTQKTLLQHIADEANVKHADEASAMAWLEREDKILLDTARGDRKKVDLWRAQASKALAGSKYTLDSSFAPKQCVRNPNAGNRRRKQRKLKMEDDHNSLADWRPGMPWRPQGAEQISSMSPEVRASYEAAQEKNVFGETFERDAKGRPIERGIGSKHNMTSNAKAALKRDDERQALLRAAAGLSTS